MMVKDFSYWPEKAAAKMAAVPVRELQSEGGDLTGRAAFQAADGAAAVPVRGAVFQLAEHGNNNGNNS